MATIIIYTILSLSLLGLLLALILYLIAQKFKVYEDPRIDGVQELLPGANCGGCGFAGCRDFADKCVKAENLESLFCPVGGNAIMQNIAGYLGQSVEEKAPMVAVVRCSGNRENRHKINLYDGYASCAIMASLYSGDTGCRYGCLGHGDCVAVCNFGAIAINESTGLPEVDQDLCTACGACAKACPKFVIEMRKKGPKNRRVYVSCINKDKGAVAKRSCKSACIGCTKCQKVCAFDAITISDSLSYIDFNKCKLCRKCVEACPTNAILELNFPVREVKPQLNSNSNE